MEVFAVLQNIQQVYEIIHWAVDVYKGIKGAPQAVLELTGEVECLVTCLNAFNYADCRKALLEASDEQQRDFSTILEGCKLNVVEIKTFVSECQIIMKATESAYKKKQKNKGLPTQFVDKLKNIWKRYRFSQADKQPMRDKLAIPLHSLNVFLVSLTFSRMSLSSGVSLATPVAPKNWAVVGRMISFKEAKFSSADLIKPGTEERIFEAAHHIILGHRCIGHCCPCCTCDADSCHCDDDDGISTLPSGSLKSPGPGRKYSGNKGKLVSDKMYLVRPKSRQRGRSKSVVRRVKREVFPTNSSTAAGRGMDDDDIGGSLASDLLDSDDSPPPRIQSYLTLPTDGPPRSPRMPSPNRNAGRNSYEHHDRGRRYHRQSSPAADFSHAEYRSDQRTRHAHISEADIERARHEARETAASEIRGVRRQAQAELDLGMDITEREVHRRSDARRRTQPETVDVRRYMEIRYGIVIDRATSEERRVAEEAEEFQEMNEELRRMSERRSRFEYESRNHHPRTERACETVFEEFDLGISEASEDESEIVINLEPETMHLPERERIHSRRERTHNHDRFSIPDTEYEPVTTILSESRTETHRRREDSRRHESVREDLERRDHELRQREEALRARERDLEERLSRLRRQERTRDRPHEESDVLRPHISIERPDHESLRPHRPGRVRRRHTETPHDSHMEIRRADEEIVDDTADRRGEIRMWHDAPSRRRAYTEDVVEDADAYRRRIVPEARSREGGTPNDERIIEIGSQARVEEGGELHSTDSEEETRLDRGYHRSVLENPEARSRRVRRRRGSSDSPPRLVIS